MFKRDQQNGQDVSITLDGKQTDLPKGMSVAASLLSKGETISRISPASKKPCSPHCLMGVCFECFMEIDGVKRQACMVEVREGMNINRHLDEEKEA